MAVSPETYGEIERRLRAAGHEHVFLADGTIDMMGIGLVKEGAREASGATRFPAKQEASG